MPQPHSCFVLFSRFSTPIVAAAPEARDEGAAGPSADPYGIEGRGKTDVLAAAGLLDSDDEGADGDAKGAGKEEGGQEEGEEEGGKRRRAVSLVSYTFIFVQLFAMCKLISKFLCNCYTYT